MMPPPNVTGALHMGHSMFVTLEDIMTRHWRMRGRPTLWLPGTDHAGIATQLVVEKMLAAEGTSRADLGREEFNRRAWQWKAKYGGAITTQLRRLGASCDWTRERFTLDEQLSRAVVEAFVSLHDKGLIYRGSYLVNWSPNLQTAVSDLEVEYSEEPGKLYFLKYPLADSSGDHLPVATTRPETLLGDTAVAVHPEDERYARFVGKKAIVPCSGGREVPVIADEYVEREFGTGALKITPGHDPNDYAIGQKLGLPTINIMNKDGSLNENAGAYRGMDRFEARKKIWQDLEAEGLAIKAEPYNARVPRSQRGGEVVEPLVSKQWFVRMQPLAEPALQALQSQALRIVPDRFEKVYNFWLENIKDWCISRQLWWGHRIPVWYVQAGDDAVSGEGMVSSTDGLEVGTNGVEEQFVVARDEAEAYRKAEQKFGKGVRLRQDPDVLDTWFSSGLWPFSTLGWPDDSAEDLSRFYPTSILETGHDILFFWVARMIMMGIEFTGRLPFHTVYLHGLVRDAQGRKMSKTLGNVIDPVDTIKDYGTDALRYTLATGTTPGQDVNLSMERLGANKAFINKIWNAGKFIMLNLPSPSDSSAWSALANSHFNTNDSLQTLPLAERWVVSEVHVLINNCTTSYERLDFNDVGRRVYDFFWTEFADWYIEASKTRLYKNEDTEASRRAQAILVYTFDKILRLLHPIIPFVTEELWQALPHTGNALIVANWPTVGLPHNQLAIEQFRELQDLVRAIRNARAEYSVEPAKRITCAVVARPASMSYLKEEAAVLVALSRLDGDTLRIVHETPSKAVHLVVREGLEAYLPLAGMIDVGKEVGRLSKQAERLQTDFDTASKRLASSSFVEKAPAAVVQGVREQAAEAQEKLSILKRRLVQLEEMSSDVATR
eukprot:SM000004S15037  [mRNA]  locus=s4:974460:982270:+ [translate_table: standard]